MERRQGQHEPWSVRGPTWFAEVDLYTREEKQTLLDARPGITDLASIVFADEGDILADTADPDIAYNQLIRPGKSRLGLFYVDNRTTLMDLRILRLTLTNSLNRERALQAVSTLLGRVGAPDDLVPSWRLARTTSSPPRRPVPTRSSQPPTADRQRRSMLAYSRRPPRRRTGARTHRGPCSPCPAAPLRRR